MKIIKNNKWFSVKDIKYIPEIVFWGLWLAIVIFVIINTIDNIHIWIWIIGVLIFAGLTSITIHGGNEI